MTYWSLFAFRLVGSLLMAAAIVYFTGSRWAAAVAFLLVMLALGELS